MTTSTNTNLQYTAPTKLLQVFLLPECGPVAEQDPGEHFVTVHACLAQLKWWNNQNIPHKSCNNIISMWAIQPP